MKERIAITYGSLNGIGSILLLNPNSSYMIVLLLFKMYTYYIYTNFISSLCVRQFTFLILKRVEVM